MTTALRVLALLVIATAARGEYSDNQFVSSPDLLPRLIAAAEKYGDPFKPGIRDHEGRPYAYYLKEATYVGNCHAPFGQVHVVSFFFIRSGMKDGGPTPPSHGHSFVAFFDGTLRLRRYWPVDLPIQGRLRFEGSTLLLDEKAIFDFARGEKQEGVGVIDGQPHLVVDGKPQIVPTW
jgi:hypothetical protein